MVKLSDSVCFQAVQILRTVWLLAPRQTGQFASEARFRPPQAGLFFSIDLNYDGRRLHSSSFADAKEGTMSARLVSNTVLFTVLVLALPAGAQDAARPPVRDASAIRQVIYPVAELVVPVEIDHTRPQSEKTCDVKLMDLLRKTCTPESWNESGGPGEVEYYPLGMSLVIRQTPRVHAQIQQLLADLRRLQDVEIAVESKLITLSAERGKQLEAGGDRKFLPADGPDAVCLTERECFLFLNMIQADRATSVMQAPMITMFNGQKCVLRINDSIATQPGDVDQFGQPPSAAQIDLGLRQIVQAVVEENHRSVRLYVNATATSQDGRNAKQRKFVTRKIENLARVKDGQTVVMKLSDGNDKQCQYMMFTPRIIHVEADEARPAPRVAARAPGELQPRVFPVADLVTPITVAAKCDNCREASWSAMMGAASPSSSPETLLIGLITNAIAQKSWHGQGGAGAIEYFPLGQAIVVWNNCEVHEEVANLLAALRRLNDLRVGLECRLVALPEAAAQRVSAGRPRNLILARPASTHGTAEEQDRIGPASTPEQLPAGAPAAKALLQIHSQAPFVLGPQESKELRSLLAEEDCKTIDQLVGAVVFNGQPARMDKTKPYTFVTEVNTALEDGKVVVKPKTRTVQIGTSIQVVPVVAADRKGLRLEIRVEHCDLAPSAPSRTVTLNIAGREEKYQLQQPNLNIQSMETKVQVGQSQTLVLPLGKVQHAAKPAAVCDIPFVGQFFHCDQPAPEECRYYVIIAPKIYAR
jgi:Bacterial type II and III secretion system protein